MPFQRRRRSLPEGWAPSANRIRHLRPHSAGGSRRYACRPTSITVRQKLEELIETLARDIKQLFSAAPAVCCRAASFADGRGPYAC
jgi:hypothetical protein